MLKTQNETQIFHSFSCFFHEYLNKQDNKKIHATINPPTKTKSNVNMDHDHMQPHPVEKVVAFIEARPRKGSIKNSLDISFSQNYILKCAPDGPVYIAG